MSSMKRARRLGRRARDRHDTTTGKVSVYPYSTRIDSACQPLPTHLNQELDKALTEEEAHQEAGAQLLEEAQQLARLGFRHMRQAQEARARRAALEACIPTHQGGDL